MVGEVFIEMDALRSIAVYFFALIGSGYIIKEGYIDINISTAFIIAFIPTGIHFSIAVWYRKRREYDALSKTPLPVTPPPQKQYKNLKIGIIAMFVYTLYLYASVEHGLTQKFTWFVVLIFLILSSGKIFLEDTEKLNSHPLRYIPFFLVVALFMLMREWVLGYPIEPIGKALMIVGSAIVTFAVLSEITRVGVKPFKIKLIYGFIIGFCSILMGLIVMMCLSS